MQFLFRFCDTESPENLSPLSPGTITVRFTDQEAVSTADMPGSYVMLVLELLEMVHEMRAFRNDTRRKKFVYTPQQAAFPLIADRRKQNQCEITVGGLHCMIPEEEFYAAFVAGIQDFWGENKDQLITNQKQLVSFEAGIWEEFVESIALLRRGI